MHLAGAGVVLMGSLSSVVAFTSPAVGGLRPRPLGQSTQQRACRWPSQHRSVLPMKAMMDPATVCLCDLTIRPTVQDPTHCHPAAVFELVSSCSRVRTEPSNPVSLFPGSGNGRTVESRTPRRHLAGKHIFSLILRLCG